MARVINIPFMQYFEPLMESGNKTATTRRKRYGQPGDQFIVNNIRYEIISVKRVTLQTVKNECWKMEGCNNPKHFEKIWIDLHHRLKFVPHMKVWLHTFRKLGGLYV
jgi:hypothetical protein